jgi:hypothetical protein
MDTKLLDRSFYWIDMEIKLRAYVITTNCDCSRRSDVRGMFIEERWCRINVTIHSFVSLSATFTGFLQWILEVPYSSPTFNSGCVFFIFIFLILLKYVKFWLNLSASGGVGLPILKLIWFRCVEEQNYFIWQNKLIHSVKLNLHT